MRVSAASSVLTLQRKLHGLASIKPRNIRTFFSRVTLRPSYNEKFNTTLPFTAFRARTRDFCVVRDVLTRMMLIPISCHLPVSRRQIFARTSCAVSSSSSPSPLDVKTLVPGTSPACSDDEGSDGAGANVDGSAAAGWADTDTGLEGDFDTGVVDPSGDLGGPVLLAPNENTGAGGFDSWYAVGWNDDACAS